MTGHLQVVATPIGNLDDLSPRAAAALADADLVLAEDTRRTATLLRHVGASPQMWSLHEHNERARADAVVERVHAGERVVLVSDAGTPTVSDPGFQLIRRCVDEDIRVEPIPGPSAMLAALVVSGLPTDRVAFEGFLPRKGGARRKRLESLATEPRTMVVFAAPHRIAGELADLAEALGSGRRAVLTRELTKRFEEVRHGTLATLHDSVGGGVRGEVTLVIAGAEDVQRGAVSDVQLDELIRAELSSGRSVRDSADAVASATGVARRRVYERAIALRKRS
ncbi:MAG: 16S rRNA (cytidine(1402)-2'-O)-methyltransferase [Nitriliruptoraceae bacterium]